MGIQAKNPNEDDDLFETSFSGEPIDEAFDGGLEAAVLTDIDHIAMVVEDLDEANAEHRDTFGVLVDHREELHGEDSPGVGDDARGLPRGGGAHRDVVLLTG